MMMMKKKKKKHILYSALFTAFALSAVCSSMAAAAQWLVAGLAITELLPSETLGEVLLTALNEPIIGTVEVLCSVILDGFISPNGQDEITVLLNLAQMPEEINLTSLMELGLECTDDNGKCPEPLLWAEGLPWTTELSSTTDDITLNAMYDFVCMLALGTPSDLCEIAETLTELENMGAPENDVLGTIETGLAGTCVNTGAHNAAVASDGQVLIQVSEGLSSLATS